MIRVFKNRDVVRCGWWGIQSSTKARIANALSAGTTHKTIIVFHPNRVLKRTNAPAKKSNPMRVAVRCFFEALLGLIRKW